MQRPFFQMKWIPNSQEIPQLGSNRSLMDVGISFVHNKSISAKFWVRSSTACYNEPPSEVTTLNATLNRTIMQISQRLINQQHLTQISINHLKFQHSDWILNFKSSIFRAFSCQTLHSDQHASMLPNKWAHCPVPQATQKASRQAPLGGRITSPEWSWILEIWSDEWIWMTTTHRVWMNEWMNEWMYVCMNVCMNDSDSNSKAPWGVWYTR